jgi:hypothetical protein
MMNKHAIFAAWAPDESVWSIWAKPVLFAHMSSAAGRLADAQSLGTAEIWPPPALSERTAIFLDLPGAEGVRVALAWAAAGYRPVPVYNAAPAPVDRETGSPGNEVVAVRPILDALAAGAPVMAQWRLPADAPPIFMLDANRRAGIRAAEAGWFDNRSISLTTDFPSAQFLTSKGISRVLLVQPTSVTPQEDLAHTLLRYQENGIEIVSRLATSFEPARPILVPRPAWYRWAFQRVLAVMGLRRNFLGGFGGTLAEPSAG